VISILSITACGSAAGPSIDRQPTTMTVGFGLPSGSNPIVGLQQVADNIALEPLITVASDGRLRPSLVESWSTSDGARLLHLTLRAGLKFHDGASLDAKMTMTALRERLPKVLGPVFADVVDFDVKSYRQFTIRLR